MKVNYKDLMVRLGVGRPLAVYDTQPWIMYDAEKNITVEAEVRSNHDQSEIEAAISFMPDMPTQNALPVEQVCFITSQKQHDGQYTITQCTIRGESWAGKLYDWQTKSCNFFRACVRDIKADKIPDIDAHLQKEMSDSSRYGGKRGEGSSKSQKINPNQLLYDRKNSGMGF